MTKFYITSAIPYVNAKPHIGWAMEIIQADTIARYRSLRGDEVLYLCGSDENSLKNVQAAEKKNIPIQQFVDTYSKYFEGLAKRLEVKFDVFQRGSNPLHHQSSQKLWKLCDENGDIYKKKYTGLYCVGCETFYSREELNEKCECLEHPGKKLDEVEEENYFFRLTKYQNNLIELIEKELLQIVPEFRRNEILSFLKRGLEDISISRSNERAKNWGVTIPGDETQKMYVWFDALNIYQSGIGFCSDDKKYLKWWPADIHVIGKGIIRFHAIYWPAFLLSAKLPLPKKLFVHEYITLNGQKISKSLGNIIDPNDIIDSYGSEALRYFLLAKISPFQDGDFSEDKFREVYNADLANGLGNLVARVAKLCESIDYQQMGSESRISEHVIEDSEYSKALQEFKFNEAVNSVWKKIAALDLYINQEKPWALIKTNSQRVTSILAHCVDEIQEIGVMIAPFMPHTSKQILEQFKGPKIISGKPLFPRILITKASPKIPA